MTVQELIDKLKTFESDATVLIRFDSQIDGMVKVGEYIDVNFYTNFDNMLSNEGATDIIPEDSPAPWVVLS